MDGKSRLQTLLWLQVRIYDLADGHDFRCLHQVDVGRLLKHYHQEQLVVQSAAERIGQQNSYFV